MLFSIKSLLGLILLSVLVACDNGVESIPEPIRTVRVEAVSKTNPLSQRRFVGRIDAISTVDLSFQVSGRLIKLPLKEGKEISKGKLIAALDSNDYQLAVQQVQAQFNLAKLDVTRKRNLFKSGSLPKALLDEAETSIKLRQVALKTAQRNLSYTRITAPFDALISQRLIDNYTNVAAHQAIVRIQKLDELRVRINIPENMIKLLDKKDNFKAVAVFKDRPKQYFPLVYREHITEASSVAQTYEVVFGLSREHNRHVLSGMTVGVMIESKLAPQAMNISIPISAIDYDEQGKARVWLFDSQTEKVSPQTVTLGAVNQNKISILSGLKTENKIVTAGAHLLRKGMTVKRFTSF